MQLILAIICILCLFFLLLSLRKQRLLRKDIVVISSALRNLQRHAIQTTQLNARDPELQSLWQSILNLHQKHQSLHLTQESYDEAIQLSIQLAAEAEQTTKVSQTILEVLSTRAGPALKAAAVIIQGDNTTPAHVAHCQGMPQERIASALLMCFDHVVAHSKWGYHNKTNGACFDFSVFNIGLSLIVPLKNKQGLHGAIWLGFTQGANVLNPHKRTLLQALAGHAAAVLHTSKQIEFEKDAREKERDFILGLSHDMRAPGNRALYGLRELLSDQHLELTKESKELLTEATTSVEEQMDLLGDVLDFAKHRKGLLEARVESFTLESAINPLVSLFRRDAQSKSISLECHTIPSLRLLADKKQTSRMISNLLSNAIKYTDEGSIKVTFEEEGNILSILIIDTGIGVPEHSRENLFEQFYRDSSSQHREGIGFGLALTKALAKLNKGELFYQPRSCGGSIFGVRMPIDRTPLQDETPAPHVERILVIDDDPRACRATARHLREISNQCIPAGSVAEARALASTIEVEAVVSDIHLGDGTSIELLNEFFSEHPLVVLSGTADPGSLKLLPPRANLEVLEKPTTKEALVNSVNRVLKAT